MLEGRIDGGGSEPWRHLTVPEAAAELGTTPEENRRKDHLLAALERIPALEPPESSETPSDHATNISSTPAETETLAETPSWWRRIFG